MQRSRLTIMYFKLILVFSAQLVNCLPHPNCSVELSNGFETFTSCKNVSLDIPVNFDVDLLSDDIEKLELNCPTDYSQPHCIILRENCKPIPVRPVLEWVRLVCINSADGNRPPYGRFLQNVKQHITYLAIWNSRVLYLDAELFRGFRSLTELSLRSSDIATISPDTFQYLGFPVVEVPSAQTLRNIDLFNNDLREFDWSVLGPVANSLVWLRLQRQSRGLASLHWSGEDFRIALRALELSYNALRSVPTRILDSIVPQNNTYFSFDNNKLCSKSDCSCCGMKDFMFWLWHINSTAQYSFLSLSCREEYFTFQNYTHFVPDLFATCKKGNRTHKGEKTPQLLLSTIDRVNECTHARAINISCSASRIAISETNFQISDATTATVYSDRTFRCLSVLHELHHKAMELGGHSVTLSTPSDSQLVSRCQNGMTDINQLDPDNSNARQLTLHTDLSEPCQNNFVRFLEYAQEVIPSEEIILPLNEPVKGGQTAGPNVANGFISGECPGTFPLIVNCTRGRQKKRTAFRLTIYPV